LEFAYSNSITTKGDQVCKSTPPPKFEKTRNQLKGLPPRLLYRRSPESISEIGSPQLITGTFAAFQLIIQLINKTNRSASTREYKNLARDQRFNYCRRVHFEKVSKSPAISSPTR